MINNFQIKSLVQRFLRVFGLQFYRLPTQEQKQLTAADEAETKTLWLRNIGVKTILDIGTNTGQFAISIHQIFPNARIYSFEPLVDCYEELVTNFKDIPMFQAFNLALGDIVGELEMYRNEYSLSSSLLAMKELHKESFPYTRKEQIQKINVVRLDDIANNLEIHSPMLIKLDVQGFEDKVISGGISTISKADIIIIELSVEELYEAQPLFDDIYKILLDLGFQYKGNYHQLHNPNDGRVLQMDGIFIKR